MSYFSDTHKINNKKEALMHLREFGYLRVPHVLKLLRVGESTLYRWVSNGKFPQPIKLGGKVIAWPVKDVTAWIEANNDAGKNKQ
jgi:prophage regulatory protein